MRSLGITLTVFLTLLSPGARGLADDQPDLWKHGTAMVVALISEPVTWETLAPEGLDALSPEVYRARSAELREHAVKLIAPCPTGQTRVVTAVGVAPLVGFEVTPAGLECLRSQRGIQRIELGAEAIADVDRGRLSALTSADRQRIEQSLARTGRARILVQLRRVAIVAPTRRTESRALRAERRDRGVLERVRSGSTIRERSLGPDHQELIVDAAGLEALLSDPEIVAIAARD